MLLYRGVQPATWRNMPRKKVIPTAPESAEVTIAATRVVFKTFNIVHETLQRTGQLEYLLPPNVGLLVPEVQVNGHELYVYCTSRTLSFVVMEGSRRAGFKYFKTYPLSAKQAAEEFVRTYGAKSFGKVAAKAAALLYNGFVHMHMTP